MTLEFRSPDRSIGCLLWHFSTTIIRNVKCIWAIDTSECSRDLYREGFRRASISATSDSTRAAIEQHIRWSRVYPIPGLSRNLKCRRAVLLKGKRPSIRSGSVERRSDFGKQCSASVHLIHAWLFQSTANNMNHSLVDRSDQFVDKRPEIARVSPITIQQELCKQYQWVEHRVHPSSHLCARLRTTSIQKNSLRRRGDIHRSILLTLLALWNSIVVDFDRCIRLHASREIRREVKMFSLAKNDFYLRISILFHQYLPYRPEKTKGSRRWTARLGFNAREIQWSMYWLLISRRIHRS